MESVHGTNNSMTQFLQQLLRIQRNSMEIVGKLTEITKSDAETVFIDLEDQYGTTQKYELPTIGALKNEISRIDNNFNMLIGQNGETVTVRLADGTFRKVMQTSLFKEPERIGTLLVPSTFNQKNNWFFESFLNPLLYISFDITNYVEYNTQQVSYKRIILNTETDEIKQYFDNSLKGRNDIDYDTLLKDLSLRGITYFVDEDIVSLPVSIARYSGSFDVISYRDEMITTTKVTGETIQEKVRKYVLNALAYSDNLQNYKNTVLLKAGDKLEVGLSTRYEIVSVDSSDNTVILKKTSGTESVPTGVGVLKIAVDSFSIKEVQINISFDERQIIFIKAIDRDTNLTTRDFSPGVAFYTNELTISTSLGSKTLEQFYKQEVLDFGASMMMLAKEGAIPAIYGETPDSPRLDSTNFKVVEVNTQKSDTKSIDDLKKKISQKNTISSELAQLQSAIDNKRQEFNTTKFNSDTERQAVQNQLENLIRQKTASSNLYASIVADLSSIAKNKPAELDQPKYRVRGFFPIPSAKTSLRTLNQEVIQFIVSYRYLRKDGTAVGTEQIDFVDNNGEKVRGYFSNWNEIQSKTRTKVYDETLGIYVWKNESVDNGDTINVNQVDIAISKGEQVELRVKSVSEAGWPNNPLMSDWSTSIVIPFPEELGTDDEVLEALTSAALEETRVNFNQDLATRGIDSHVSSSFVQKDKYYAHSTSVISSGFFNSDGSIVNLYEKLVAMDNEIATLRSIIEKAKGKLSVYIVDPNGEKYTVANNSMIDLFAGYYSDIVKTLPVAQQKGAIINAVYKLVIQNTAVSPLQLVSLFPGGLDQDLPDSSLITNNDDYKNSRRYETVPISLSSLDSTKTSNFDSSLSAVPYQAAPFQSAQRKSQYIYLRATDIGLLNPLVYNTGATSTFDNSYYPSPSGVSSPFVWNMATGSTTGALNSDFCVHSLHPDVVANPGATVGFFNNPGVSTTSPAKYPKFAHSKAFNKQNHEIDGKKQIEYCKPDFSSSLYQDKYPVKMGFYTNDRYLIGQYTCGSYLFLSPATYSDLLVNGTDYRATREVEFGDQFQITIPIIFQYRMTDFYGAGVNGTGRIGGLTTLNNLYYSKKLGIDIYVKEETVFSFDIQVSSKYKVDSPSQTGISPVQNTQLNSIQSSSANQIF